MGPYFLDGTPFMSKDLKSEHPNRWADAFEDSTTHVIRFPGYSDFHLERQIGWRVVELSKGNAFSLPSELDELISRASTGRSRRPWHCRYELCDIWDITGTDLNLPGTRIDRSLIVSPQVAHIPTVMPPSAHVHI